VCGVFVCCCAANFGLLELVGGARGTELLLCCCVTLVPVLGKTAVTPGLLGLMEPSPDPVLANIVFGLVVTVVLPDEGSCERDTIIVVAAGVQYAAVFTTVVMGVAALAIKGLGSLTRDSNGCANAPCDITCCGGRFG
jgi:hypothetical protein